MGGESQLDHVASFCADEPVGVAVLVEVVDIDPLLDLHEIAWQHLRADQFRGQGHSLPAHRGVGIVGPLGFVDAREHGLERVIIALRDRIEDGGNRIRFDRREANDFSPM